MRHTLGLSRLFDIRVGLHASCFPLYALMVVSIAGNIAGLPRTVAFSIAAVCAALLFACVIAHEFAHALVARRYGVRTRAITLFLFGGVATLESEPPSARAEVMIALAGPALSALLAAAAFGALMLVERFASGPGADAAGTITAYIALANAVLAAFNLVPAFPLDGGRVLRAAIWHARKSRPAATGAAALVGLVVAALLVGGGTAGAIATHAWNPIWYALIGAFLLRQAWQQLCDSRAAERYERRPDDRAAGPVRLADPAA